MEIADKICLITGGLGGIGTALIERLLLKRAKFVAILDLAGEANEKKSDELLSRHGSRVGFYKCDVTNKAEFIDIFDRVLGEFGAIDILVNNAGVANENTPDLVMDTNYKATVNGCLAMIDRMGKHRGGRGGCCCVNTASIMGLVNGLLPIYCSTKHAVVSFTRTMDDLQCKNTGVRVMAVCPGLTETPMIVDIMTKKLSYVDLSPNVDVARMITQPPDHVAEAFVAVIERGRSGEVWVCEDNLPPYPVQDCPDYKTLKRSE
ncbi:hypothetical protein TKK_0003355 [Trichogramma kaykai]